LLVKQLLAIAFSVLLDSLEDLALVRKKASAFAKVYVVLQDLAGDIPELAAEITKRGGHI